MKAIARFKKKENLFKDLAYVDQLAKDKNGVEYPLARQHVVDRTVDAKGTKAEGFKETVRPFLTLFTEKI